MLASRFEISHNNKMFHELDLRERLANYKSAKKYIIKEYPDLCSTKQELVLQSYDEAVQYGIEFGY